ncbi:hypothetical protein SLEP1_g8425 [Rubroshorea leprosula]|uniref:Retrotransposon gag domain-containing protein n=1 Tax=Rubroshorea leprosula TaxID=152421 RepID=A0AAV5I7R0_9ROSI|nr:hypothetical protein SLEP1_g8425 [Rubroshorea leprosula]
MPVKEDSLQISPLTSPFTIQQVNDNSYGYGISFFMAPFHAIIPSNSGDGLLALFRININSIVSVVNVAWKSSIRTGKPANAWVDYNSSTHNLSMFLTYADNPVYSGNSTLWFIVDLRDILPEKVRVGFSASTGSVVAETHTVQAWYFNITNLDTRKKNEGLVLGLGLGFGVLACGLVLFGFILRRIKSKWKTGAEAIDVYEGAEEAPALTISKNGKEESNPEFENWLNNDGLLTNWLLGTMNEEALSVVVGCESTFQIWRCLEEHYLPSTKQQELHLKGLLVVKRSDGESLEDFVRKFKNTCDQLAAIRKPLDDLDKVFQLSRVVGSRYQPYNLAVLSKAPYPTFNQYTTGLQNNERDLQAAEQENKDKTPVYAQTFVAHRGRGNRGRSYGGRYFNSRGRGVVQAGNYNWFGNQRTGNYNSFGNHKNFIANNNPLPQQNMPQKFDHAYQSEELPQALATMTLLEKKDQNTYVDTSATDHMTSDAGKLYTKRPYTGNHNVFTGDGTPLDISHIGSASIGSLKLNNVLVVSNLKKNLLSVSKFTKENPCIFEFSSNGFVIKDQATQAVLARGTKKGQLYALEEEQKHCDGGGEFSSLAFVNHLAEGGIKQQVSCPGTPE